jgi:hypothetical protein
MNQNQNSQYLLCLKRALILYLCFLTTFISFALESPTPSVASSNLVLWGKVLDPQGMPVSGANLEWVPMFQFDNITSTLSDRGGNIFCTNPQLRKNDDFLICRHPHYATWGKSQVKSKNFKSEHLFEIKLGVGPSLNLLIQSEDKKMLAGANIFIERALTSNDDDHDFPHFEKLVSDAKGLATLNQLSTGPIKLLIQKSGYVYPRKFKIDHSSKKELHTIGLQKAKNFQFLINYPTKQTAKNVKIIYAFSDNKISDFSSLKEDYFTLEDSAESARSLQVPLKGYLVSAEKVCIFEFRTWWITNFKNLIGLFRLNFYKSSRK